MPQDSTRSRSRREDHIHGVTTLSPVSVRARAVIPYGGGIVVAREQRRGKPHLTIPGGRVGQGEGAVAAALREVYEETGLPIELGPLLYVAEVVAPARRQDLNLVFLAQAAGGPEGEVDVIGPDEADVIVLPPILERIRGDQAAGWKETGVWLGNVWQGELGLG